MAQTRRFYWVWCRRFVLCTPRLSADWLALRSHFEGHQPPAADGSHSHMHKRSAGLPASALQRSSLSEDERTFVRECMYPQDTALFRRACGAHEHVLDNRTDRTRRLR